MQSVPLVDSEQQPQQPPHPEPRHKITPLASVLYLFNEFKGNYLVILLPIALASSYAGWSPIATFILNFIVIIPLSKMLGTATEQIALMTSPILGSLLNVTFGNAIELIISIIALSQGLIKVVQNSLLGSILSNLLLVLGGAFLAGGWHNKIQKFSDVGAQTNAALLSLAVLAILIPAAFDLTTPDTIANDQAILTLSRATSILLLVVYGLFLYFQLKTHRHIYEGGAVLDDDDVDLPEKEPEEHPEMSLWVAILMLVVVTVAVSLAAEGLVGSIEPLTKTVAISESFVALILIPIVGNAAEHVSAISFASKKIELAVGIAIGSSLQIALFVTPLVTLIGWTMNVGMSLDFHGFGSFILFASVLMVNYVIADGKSHWFEGVLLLTSYLIIAIAFFEYTE